MKKKFDIMKFFSVIRILSAITIALIIIFGIIFFVTYKEMHKKEGISTYQNKVYKIENKSGHLARSLKHANRKEKKYEKEKR